jgi:hypothetical protein
MHERVSLLVAILLVAPLAAEARQLDPAIDIAGGWVGFADDGVVSEAMIGGAVRWHLSPRVSIGPEVVYIQGRHHSHLVVTGNLTFVFRPGQPVRPFLVAGGGLFQTRESFPAGDFTSGDPAFTAGGGVLGRVTDRVSLGLDARVGWEPHIRIGGIVSVRLGR